VELRGVSKRYQVRGPWVLRHVDANLAPGQLIRVAGPNGCGKSTLLRLVCGASAPTRGRISARPRSGYVPERFPGELPFTARGYLRHLGRLHGLRGIPLEAAVTASIDRFGLGPYAGKPLRELSKGNSQKVAVAQALLGGPELLVLDEAWTGLDAGTRATLDTVVAERVTGGATVLFVDHDPARLAGQLSLCWSLIDGRLHESSESGATDGVVTAGVAGVAHVTDGVGESAVLGGADEVFVSAGHAPPLQTIVIEFSGYGGEVGALRGLAGVVSVEPGRLRVRAQRSDDVLRRLLTADGNVHIERVVSADGLSGRGAE
jgi:ABC-2 type transport system ATP-binding protein